MLAEIVGRLLVLSLPSELWRVAAPCSSQWPAAMLKLTSGWHAFMLHCTTAMGSRRPWQFSSIRGEDLAASMRPTGSAAEWHRAVAVLMWQGGIPWPVHLPEPSLRFSRTVTVPGQRPGRLPYRHRRGGCAERSGHDVKAGAGGRC